MSAYVAILAGCVTCAACNSRVPDGDGNDGAELVCEDQDLVFGLALLRLDEGSVDFGLATDLNRDGTIGDGELEVQSTSLDPDEFVGLTLDPGPVALAKTELVWLDDGTTISLADACADCIENVAGPDTIGDGEVVWLASAPSGYRLLSSESGTLWSGELDGDDFDVAGARTGEVYLVVKDAGEILKIGDGSATLFYDAGDFPFADDVIPLEWPNHADYHGALGLVVVGQGNLVNIYSLHDRDADGEIADADELTLEITDGSATGPSLSHIAVVAQQMLWRDRGNYSIDAAALGGNAQVVLPADGLMGEDEDYGLLGLATPPDPCALEG